MSEALNEWRDLVAKGRELGIIKRMKKPELLAEIKRLGGDAGTAAVLTAAAVTREEKGERLASTTRRSLRLHNLITQQQVETRTRMAKQRRNRK